MSGNGKYECLVLVHGFDEKLHEGLPQRLFNRKQSHHQYSKTLEKWARSLSASPGKLQGVDLMVWSFKTAHFLAGNVGINKLAQDLDMHLQAKFESRLPDDSLDSTSKQPAGNPTLVFVTHGVGAWVVRELFGLNLSINYGPYVCGVVFVDALQSPDADSTPTRENYSEYLIELTRTFKLKGIARKHREGLVDQMELADNPSIKARALRGRSWLNGARPAKLSHEKLWLLSQNSETKVTRQVEIKHRLSRIEKEVEIMLRGVTSGQFVATYTDASPVSPGTPLLENEYQLGALTSSWSPVGSAISKSDRSECTDLDSSSSRNSMETPRKPAGDASSVLPSRPGLGSFLTQEVIHPVTIRDIESNAMSIARGGKLRDAEDLLNQYLHTETNLKQETSFLDRLRFRLTLCVLRLQQGRLDIVEEEFGNIAAEMSRDTAGFDESRTLGLRTALVIWRSVLLVSKGSYDSATFDLEDLMISGSSTERLLQSDRLLRAQLHITLAMCYASTGNRCGAEAQMERARPICSHEFESAERASTNAILLLDNKTNFSTVCTRIHISFGHYQLALEVCQKALKDARAECGTKHFQTLELASIEGQLAISSSPSRAEKTCSKTLRLIVKELGIEHPLALETTGHVVDALLARSRYVEAADTARSLYKLCQSALGDRHPLTLRSLHQLSRLHLAIGKYTTAHDGLTRLLNTLAAPDKVDLLSTLKLRSDLAEVCYKLGRNRKATELARNILNQHAKMYRVLLFGEKVSGESFGSKWWRSSLSSSTIQGVEQDFMSSYTCYKFFESSREENDNSRVHPDALSALQVLATIEQAEHMPAIIEFVHDQRKPLFGKDSMQYMDSQYQLAVCYQGFGRLGEAAKLLEEVWNKRRELLSPTNPQTLSVERDLIITVTAHGEPALPPSLSFVGMEGSAVNIAGLHEWQLGKLHPETLKSQIWAFTVQTTLSVKSPEALDTLSTIHGRLRDESVQKERLIESLNMEDSLACFYHDQKMPRDALFLWESLESLMERLGPTEDRSMDETLKSFRRRLSNDIKRSKREVEDTGN